MSDGASRLSIMDQRKHYNGGGRKEFIEANDLRKEKEVVNPGHGQFTTLVGNTALPSTPNWSVAQHIQRNAVIIKPYRRAS